MTNNIKVSNWRALYPSSLKNDQFTFCGAGKQVLALEATFLSEVTPHIEEGAIRKSYTIPALSIKEASGSLGLSQSK